MVGFILVVDLIILLVIVPMLGKHLLVVFCIFVPSLQSCSSQLSSMMCSFILVTVFRISMALLMIFIVLLLMAILVAIMLLVIIIMLLVLLLSLSSMFGSHFLMMFYIFMPPLLFGNFGLLSMVLRFFFMVDVTVILLFILLFGLGCMMLCHALVMLCIVMPPLFLGYSCFLSMMLSFVSPLYFALRPGLHDALPCS